MFIEFYGVNSLGISLKKRGKNVGSNDMSTGNYEWMKYR